MAIKSDSTFSKAQMQFSVTLRTLIVEREFDPSAEGAVDKMNDKYDGFPSENKRETAYFSEKQDVNELRLPRNK